MIDTWTSAAMSVGSVIKQGGHSSGLSGAAKICSGGLGSTLIIARMQTGIGTPQQCLVSVTKLSWDRRESLCPLLVAGLRSDRHSHEGFCMRASSSSFHKAMNSCTLLMTLEAPTKEII